MSIDSRMLLALALRKRRQLLNEDPVACQQRVLLDLVRGSAHTMFGRQHGFSSIRSTSDFLTRVPPRTYQDLRGNIEAILEGGANVLFRGRPVCFAITSGTTGKPKLIPLNRALLFSVRMSAVEAGLLGGLSLGTMTWHRGKTLYVGPRKGYRFGSWLVFPEGSAYAYLQTRLLRARFIPDYRGLPELHQAHDFESLIKLSRRHTVTAIAGNPLEIADFVRSTRITISSVRIVFNCGYFAADNACVYEAAFPNAAVVDVYGANEGTYGLPFFPGHFIMNCRRVFFSFLRLKGGGPAVGLAEARVGEKYGLCVTTPGGLWNYRTDDVVSLVSIRPPVLRICGRAERCLAVAGEVITEDEVVNAVRAAGLKAERYFMTCEGLACVLHVDGEAPDPEAVDRELRSLNPDYDRLRKNGKLQSLTLRRKPIMAPRDRKPMRIANESGQVLQLLGTSRGEEDEPSIPPVKSEYLP